MINRICLEGIDGSGKTTAALELQKQLALENVTATIKTPYKVARELLGYEIYEMWRQKNGAKVAITTLKNAIALCEEESNIENADVLIFDRHWMTAFTEIVHDQELINLWGNTFVPAALMVASPIVATRRLTNARESPWSMIDSQIHYDNLYREISRKYPQSMLGLYRTDMGNSPEAIARTINWDMHILR